MIVVLVLYLNKVYFSKRKNISQQKLLVTLEMLIKDAEIYVYRCFTIFLLILYVNFFFLWHQLFHWGPRAINSQVIGQRSPEQTSSSRTAHHLWSWDMWLNAEAETEYSCQQLNSSRDRLYTFRPLVRLNKNRLKLTLNEPSAKHSFCKKLI